MVTPGQTAQKLAAIGPAIGPLDGLRAKSIDVTRSTGWKATAELLGLSPHAQRERNAQSDADRPADHERGRCHVCTGI